MGISITAIISIWIVVGSVLVWGWRVLNWVWLRPKNLEKCLRDQGFSGNSYRFLFGDTKEMVAMTEEAKSKPMTFSHDISHRVFPSVHQTVKNYGKNSFMWLGPHPRMLIMNPEQLKYALSLIDDIQRPNLNPLVKLLANGIIGQEGAKWAKHRKIINPAFHLEKLKGMISTFSCCCCEMINELENVICEDGSSELDVMPYLKNLTADIISRAAFGSNFEEGNQIFQLQQELSELVMPLLLQVYIPGWRFLPTKLNNRVKKINEEIKDFLSYIINKRKKALEAGEVTNDDLLGILMESNFKEIREHGKNEDFGMSINDIIEECRLFYIAGQETTATLLIWTMVLLSSHPEWQERARTEVLQVFGHNKPSFDGLSRLKTVTMILNEVLRLYPPVGMVDRRVEKETRLGNLILPAGVKLGFPIILIHHDHELWGKDANEFNPERFSKGVAKATNNQISFFPFGWGPQICIGQNFAMIEAKVVMSMLLQNFSFELSSSYTHAPATFITTQPQHGVPIILRKL